MSGKSTGKISFISSIGGKLILISSLVILIALTTLTIISVMQMSASLTAEAVAKLEAIHNAKHDELLSFFERTGKDSEVISTNAEILNAVDDLLLYHLEMDISPTGNYDITGKSDDLTHSYEYIYNEINVNLQKYNDVYGYYDVLIVCAAHGHVMYSNGREADLGENLSVGQYKNSGLAKLWGEIIQTKQTIVEDLEPYAPSGGIPAMFIGSPIIDKGDLEAVVILQINNDDLNEVFANVMGMGESGEVYAVGMDRIMRTESRFSKQGESSILSLKVDTPASQILDIDDSNVFVKTFKDYRGIKVLSVYSHAAIDEVLNSDFDWAMIAEIDEAEVMAPVRDLTILIIIVALVIIILVIIFMVFFARSLSGPIQAGVDAAEQLSVGNLNLVIDSKHLARKDEIGLLSRALHEMINKLSDVVSVVLTGSEQIATASEQLSSGNQDLSNRTEQQATALEQTSAAIEEMNSSIRSNADNTGTADQLSKDALDKTSDGSAAVTTMITSMTEISTSSNRIAEIIEVINNIAFQTNLLALNASIEAARAGEQGKGFAVVAVEVRKLAKRSDKAATEIAEIIKTSNKKVDDGVIIANQAGDMLTEINGAVKKVTALVGEISAASQEQLSSVDQIDKTITSLDENTQKNAALVEEAASSTEELSAQAEELNTNMQFFKLSRYSQSTNMPANNGITGIKLVEDSRERQK